MEFQIIFKLVLALILGGILGLERETKKREAGFQTYSLVSLGACLFTIVSISLAKLKIIDPSIVIGIAVGVGFIGAGTIFRTENRIEGVTTAAGLWTTAAIGFTIGSGFYSLAIIGAFFVLLILFGFGLIEEKILKYLTKIKKVY